MKTTKPLLLLVLILAIGIGAYAYQKNAVDEKASIAEVVAYLEGQKLALEGAETVPLEIDPETGRVTRIQVDDPMAIDRLLSYTMNATAVRRVKSIPELACPLVYVGDQLSGNHEKLYYSEGGRILALSLDETDSLAFQLYLTGVGSVYPEVREAYTEGVIRQLQEELRFGPKDLLTFFSNGELENIDIKTQETAEVLFQCIRNSVQIADLTDVDLEPMALPIAINGQGTGTFDMFFATYRETGQFLCFSFSAADAKAFEDYVMALK